MRLQAIALFVHILGVIATFSGLSMQQRAGSRLRKATTYAEARPWSDVLAMTRPMVPSGAVMLVLTGAYLTTQVATPRPPVWIVVAIVAVVVMGILALAVVNRGFGAIAAGVAAGDGPLSGDAAGRITNRRLWSALGSANAAALGTLWLMTAKPGPLESVLVVTIAVLIGAVAGRRLGGPGG